MILNADSLIRNRHKDKFFGIDYYANICFGSNPMLKYLSTPLDFFPLSNEKPPMVAKQREEALFKRMEQFDEQKIIGLYDNPDVYQCHESIANIIEKASECHHGLFIITSSLNLLHDIEQLRAFNQHQPLLIALPIGGMKDLKISALCDYHRYKQIETLSKALLKHHISFGYIIKPVIPYVNDDVDQFKTFLARLISHQPSFIYPTFSITFDSKKLNHFYELIDHELPELKSRYFDEYGYKKSWMSPNASQLKRTFIFEIKKTKIAYSMKQIIDLYKTSSNLKQMALF